MLSTGYTERQSIIVEHYRTKQSAESCTLVEHNYRTEQSVEDLKERACNNNQALLYRTEVTGRFEKVSLETSTERLTERSESPHLTPDLDSTHDQTVRCSEQ
ncbi:hypothetical protein LR48_Vigan263s000600 [Vigna angularis]|uniref:Uncharacterized protein n=1 Tax=Phaseolus angularis TaxID=3914 RepID=A0A0L9T734_PHAAN|nr:hypothetical protein LR48_Vigan263s000600 [Vigna angularis]